MQQIASRSLRRGDTDIGYGYWDFATMLNANKTGYFPYTPAMTLMRGLRESTDMLLEEGMNNVFDRHFRLAEGVRRAVAAWGLRPCAVDPATASDTVTAIVVPDGSDANAFINVLGSCAIYASETDVLAYATLLLRFGEYALWSQRTAGQPLQACGLYSCQYQSASAIPALHAALAKPAPVLLSHANLNDSGI